MKAKILARLGERVRVAKVFYDQGTGLCDKMKLAFAGLARGRPFGMDSLYGRSMRRIASAVTARVVNAGDLFVQLDLTDLVDTMVFEELVIEGIYPLNDVPFSPDFIVDAGSCRGLFSIMAHARFPESAIVAIEPVPENARRIRLHFEENEIGAKVIEAVISVDQLPVVFTGRGFGGYIGGEIEEGGFEVMPVNLLDILSQNHPERLLLKMDIEGAEREVLPAIAEHLPRQTVIFLETHHGESECDVYLSDLRRFGFKENLIRRRPSEEIGAEYVERVFIRV